MRLRSLSLVFVAVFILFQTVACVYAGDFLALQGNVKQGGVDLASGNLKVLIYDSASGGNLIYNSSNDFNNAIANGKYDVLLGNTSQELNLMYGQKYYFEIYVNGEKLNYSNGMDRQVFQSAVGNISSVYLNLSGGGYVPYVGASQNVDLGNNNFTVNNSLYVVLGSGTGVANKALSVGIGTSNPVTQLEIVNERNSGQGGANRHLTLTNNIGNLPGGAQINFRKSAGTYLSPSIVIDGQTLGSLNFQGYNSTGYSTVGLIAFNVNTSGTTAVNATHIPVDILFNSVPDGTFSASEGTKMIIKSNGNVGIGTANPSNGLTIYSKGGGVTRDLAIIHESNNAGSPVIWFKKAHGALGGLSNIVQSQDVLGAVYTIPWNGSEYSSDMLSSGMAFVVNQSGSDTIINNTYIPSDIVFYTDPTGGSTIGAIDNIRMIITRSGNVGIGTNTPTQKLEVNGNYYGNVFTEVNLSTDTCPGTNNQTQYTCSYGELLATCTDTYEISGINYTRHVTCGRGNAVISGSVGIGTATPQAKLDVESTSGGAATIGSSSNSATGDYAIAMGDNTNASGNYSTAMGVRTRASGDVSTAMGMDTIASGEISTAMGDGTTASGFASTAMGMETRASGHYSTAMGRFTTASGNYSTAIGRGITCSQENATCIGGGNVGIGTGNPSQMLDVRGNGNFSGTIYIFNDTDISTLGGGNSSFNQSLTDDIYVPYTGANKSIDLGTQTFSTNGTANFDGGWQQGGVTIDDGKIFAQVGYFYNISSLSITHLEVNGSMIPYFNNTFDLGSENLSWRNGYFTGNLNVGGDVFINGQNITGDYVPYTGAINNVDLGEKNLNTTGEVSGGWNSRFGGDNQYWQVEDLDLDFANLGHYAMLSGYSNGTYTHLGVMADSLIIYDKYNVNTPSLYFASNDVVSGVGAIQYNVTSKKIRIFDNVGGRKVNLEVNGNVTADYYFGDGRYLTNLNASNLNISNLNLSGNYVPYTGATNNVDLGEKNLSTNGTIKLKSNGLVYVDANGDMIFKV